MCDEYHNFRVTAVTDDLAHKPMVIAITMGLLLSMANQARPRTICTSQTMAKLAVHVSTMAAPEDTLR